MQDPAKHPLDRQQRWRVGLVLAPLVIFASLAAMFALALQKGDPSRIPSALIGRAAPSITLAPVEGLIEGDAVGRLLHVAPQALADVLLV